MRNDGFRLFQMWKGSISFSTYMLILGSLCWKVPGNKVGVRKMWKVSIILSKDLSYSTINIKINCTSLHSILGRTITIFLVQKYINSAKIGSVALVALLLDYFEGWLGNRPLISAFLMNLNVCEDDSLFYSSNKKKDQQNWHPALEAKHSELLLELPIEI